MAARHCFEAFDRSRKECADWRDNGYETCSEWGQDCVSWAKECVVSWIPVIGPAICKVFEWVCRALEWVCTAAVWVSQWVCHAWNFLKTTVCLVGELVGAVLSLVGVIIKAIFSIPIIGALLKQLVNLITGAYLGFWGAVAEGWLCGVLGQCFEKRIRVCLIITANSDGQPVATASSLQPMVKQLVDTFRNEANIAVEVTYGDGARVPNLGQIGCDFQAWLEDIWLTGSQFENAASLHCRERSFASVVGLGSPIYAFCVPDIKGTLGGCSLGPLTNYITFEPSDCGGNTTLAHEVGHACNLLLHGVFSANEPSNLMYDSCNLPGPSPQPPAPRDQLSPFQVAIVRGSKYCTY